jgi:hypothetical protein
MKQLKAGRSAHVYVAEITAILSLFAMIWSFAAVKTIALNVGKTRVMEALDVDWRGRRGPSNPATLLWIMLY